MSQRTEDVGVIQQLRDVQDRLNRLETQNNKTRKNDIRLSDTIVTADSPNDRLCLENLVTGDKVCIGEVTAFDASDPAQAMWSFSGPLTNADQGTFSPPYFCDRDCTARQILVGRGYTDTFTGTVRVCVHFNNDSVIMVCDLVSPAEYVTKEINIPLLENDDIRVELIDDGTNAEDISIFVRFGTTTVALSATDCAF